MPGQHERLAALVERMRREQEELAGQLRDLEAELAGWEDRVAGEEAGLGEQQATLNMLGKEEMLVEEEKEVDGEKNNFHQTSD
jgi:hypothetical protein